MKWIKISVIVVLSALVCAWFAASDQQVAVDGTEDFAIDPSGNLYLLSDEGELTRVSPQGRRLWSVQLDREDEDGNAMRYLDLIADGSGSLYIAAQTYERRVDAAGAVQDVILTEEVQTWSSDGVQQDSVLRVDKTTLSQYSTSAYIQKLQMQGETLLALCCDQGRFDVIAAQPYSEEPAAVIASYDLGDAAEEVEDCAALSDGTLVYSTKGGGLAAVSPDGTSRDLSQLVGQGSLPGQLSADETDRVYFMDRSNGVLYALDLAAYTVERLYSPDTVVDAETGTVFSQLQGAFAVGNGDFCAVSIDGGSLLWARFGAQSYVISSVYKGWSALEIAKAAGVFLAAAALLTLAGWGLGRLFRRSRLTGKAAGAAEQRRQLRRGNLRRGGRGAGPLCPGRGECLCGLCHPGQRRLCHSQLPGAAVPGDAGGRGGSGHGLCRRGRFGLLPPGRRGLCQLCGAHCIGRRRDYRADGGPDGAAVRPQRGAGPQPGLLCCSCGCGGGRGAAGSAAGGADRGLPSAEGAEPLHRGDQRRALERSGKDHLPG